MHVRRHRLVSATIMVVTLLLASCAAGSPTPGPGDTSSMGTKPYGTLKIGSSNLQGPQFDPQLDIGSSFAYATGAVFDALVTTNLEGTEYAPGIAERWELSADGKSQTFFIRKGVKFHDGSDLTGADVKFSLDRMLAPESLGSGIPTFRAVVSKVELKDDYTVVISLNEPRFDLLGVGSQIGAVVPKKYIEEKGVEYFRKHPVGSGPFKVVSFTRDDRFELEALDSHWREVPKFKTISGFHVLEEATKVAMLKTGELDLAVVAPDSAPGLKSAGVSILVFSGGTIIFGYPLYEQAHPERYAIGDVRVRKALQLALNNKEIGDTIFGGYAEPYYMFYVYPWTAPWFDPVTMKPDPYDPEQAKRLIAEAGYGNGFNVRINDMGGGGVLSTVDMAIAGYWRKVGVNAEVVPWDYATLLSKMLASHPDVWGSYWLRATAGSRGSPNPTASVPTAYHSKKGIAKNHNNARIDWLIDNYPTTMDPALRAKYGVEFATLSKNERISLSVVMQSVLLAHSAKVGDVVAFASGDVTARMFLTTTHAK